MALLVHGELHDVDHVGYQVDGVLKADRKIGSCGFGGHEFNVGDVGAFVVVETVLVAVL